MKTGVEAGLAVTPALGPAVITLFGVDVPVLALTLSIVGLLLARALAPVPLRKLNRKQEIALTVLLVIILFLIVTGTKPLGDGQPIGAGMGVVWGIGLGFSGMLIIEFFGERVVEMLKVLIGKKD